MSEGDKTAIGLLGMIAFACLAAMVKLAPGGSMRNLLAFALLGVAAIATAAAFRMTRRRD
jgi:hypothetical protein